MRSRTSGWGLSPRGRGNLVLVVDRHLEHGSIPARAGEPPSRRAPRCRSGVYPRAGGGTSSRAADRPSVGGLSPRGRGNRRLRRRPRLGIGSIPARAGEPIRPKCCTRPSGVYPRAGGGTIAFLPRDQWRWGLSPRGRGNPLHLFATHLPAGSIPARAGEPPPSNFKRCHMWVYPRAGGGTRAFNLSRSALPGLSPRGRGNHSGVLKITGGTGSIPARAGEPEHHLRDGAPDRVYPRAGGGTLVILETPASWAGLSPRGRGNRLGAAGWEGLPGSIPARAGEPSSGCSGESSAWVYPRAGGGTAA